MRKLTILLLLCMATSAWADDVQVFTVADPRQDAWVVEGWVEELSTAPHDPINELITATVVPWCGHIPCPVDYTGQANLNVQVAITNNTQRYFTDLYYVGDVHDDGSYETKFTNVDELVADITPGHSNNLPGLAFKIDNIGANTPLVFESMTPDLIFEPGETWQFVIQEYWNMWGQPASNMASVGAAPYGAIAQNSMFDTISSGSIITPEPAMMTLLAVGATALLRRRKA